jgi:hypothetical protein
VIDTQDTITATSVTVIMGTIYACVIVFMVLMFGGGKALRRWWRRRKLHIPNEAEASVKTISGPTWDIRWVKTSEAKEKRPDEQRSTVLGCNLSEVFAVLKARYGDEFDEKNVRGTEKRDYSNVIVGIPE